MALENQGKKHRIESLKISADATILQAIKQMDRLDIKLLLVYENDAYLTLVSIGDIQRAIISGMGVSTKLKEVLKRKVKTCSVDDSEETIRSTMLNFRTEFMPILDEQGQLQDVIFWDELFSDDRAKHKRNDLDVPVVIMAGGQGTRLKPITNVIPKPLVPIGERPIMQVIMDDFKALGSKRFFATVNYKSEMIISYFKNPEVGEYYIEYVHEDKPLGTAGSLSLLKGKINETFFVSNCDILLDQDFYEIYEYHKQNKNELTVVSALYNLSIPYGTLEVGEEGILKNLTEKPDLAFNVNTGVYIIEPHLLNEIPEDTFFHITHLMENIIERKGKVGVFPISMGSWHDIGDWKEYQKTQLNLGGKKKF